MAVTDFEREVLAITRYTVAAAERHDQWRTTGDPDCATCAHEALSALIAAAGRAHASLTGEETTARDARAEIDRLTGEGA